MPRVEPPSSPEGTVWFGGHPQSATICLRFCDDNLDPEEITALMAHAPTRSQRKGQPILDDFGQIKRTGRTGSWLLDRSLGENETIEEGIQLLLGELPANEKVWVALGQRFRVDLLCDVSVLGVNQGFELSPNVLKMLAQRGISLGVDIFCKPDKEQTSKLQERLR